MNILQERAKKRERLIRLAKDSNVKQLAELFLHQYRDNLEHLETGDQIPSYIPVGRDRFNDWLRKTIDRHYPSLSGLVENERALKEYANQVADAVAKSNTDVQNPLKDYEVSNDPIYVKAQEEQSNSSAVGTPQMTPAKPDVENLYMAPDEQSRYDPDNPGVMLKRVNDKVYQSPITGDFYQFGTWKDVYDAHNGREVTFETGVQNQSNAAWNEMYQDLHTTHSFLSPSRDQDWSYKKTKSEGYNEEKDLYNTFEDKENLISPHRVEEKEASNLLNKIIKTSKTEKTAQFFGETTVPTRQCPDHPGMQTYRIEDGIRQCPLDNRIYDFNRGFTTDDGVQHNGGSVAAQHSIPPGSSVIRLDKKANLSKEAMDTQKTHSFLWQVLQYLPAESRERKILNLKFQKNLSLDEAIMQFEEAERLAAEQQDQQQNTNM